MEVGNHLGDHLLEREHEDGVLGVVVFEVRLAEHVRDQSEQPARLALDRPEGLDGDRIVGQRRSAEDVHVALDARQRRSQLVRRGRDEVALHPVELAELRDRVLFALQQIGELVGLILELVVLSAERPGDADHQRQHHDVEREQTDRERDRERAGQPIDLGLDHGVVLVDLDHTDDRTAHPDAERHVRLEQPAPELSLAHVLVRREIGDVALQFPAERFLQVVLEGRLQPDLLLIVGERHHPGGAPELDPEDPRVGEQGRSDRRLDLVVPGAGDGSGEVGCRELGADGLVRHKLGSARGRALFARADVTGPERRDERPDHDEDDQAREREHRHDPCVRYASVVPRRHTQRYRPVGMPGEVRGFRYRDQAIPCPHVLFQRARPVRPPR